MRRFPICGCRLACLLIVAADTLLFAAGGVEGEMAALDREVTALLGIRDGLLKELAGKSQSAEPPLTVRIVFGGALAAGGSSDLPVTLRRHGGVWIWAAGRADAADRVDASGLRLWKERGGYRLAGDLRATLAPPYAGKPAFSEDVTAVFAVDATVMGEELTGTYKTGGYRPIPETPRFDYSSSDGNGLSVEHSPVPAGEGTLKGWAKLAEWKPALPTPPEEDILNDPPAVLTVKRAQARDVAACELYRQIHACGLALRHGWNLAHAFELTPDYRPVWPLPASGKKKSATASKPPVLPDLEDLSDLGLGLETPARPESSAEATAERRKQALATLARIRLHAEKLRLAAERWHAERLAVAEPPALETCADPDFGPWFGENALPSDDAGRNRLPDLAAADGPQDWHRVEKWRFLGPFPALWREADVPGLPEIIPDFHAGIVPNPEFVPAQEDGGDERGKDPLFPPDEEPELKTPSGAAGLGLIAIPTAGTSKSPSLPMSFYAHSEVFSPEDRDVWMGLQVRNGGSLWIDGRLVWRAPTDGSLRSQEEVYRFPARLRKGVNPILLRIDSHGGGAWFALRVCVRGRPRSADEAARHRAAIEAAYVDSAPVPAVVQGWRGNWLGTYPGANPPLAWDLEKRINVLWETPLGLSHATPVIVGDKLFVLEDPAVLVCLDKRSGKVLWRQQTDVFDLLPADTQEKIGDRYRRMRQAVARLDGLGRSAAARRAALLAEGLTEAQADETLRDLDETARQRKSILRECGVLGPAWGDWTSHTFSTPVTDGRHIWFKSNTGVIACYDLEGRRQWAVRHPGSTGTNAHVPSPVLVAGKLLVMLPESGLPSAGDYVRCNCFLYGYDAGTGALLWKVDTAGGVLGEITGTPLPLRLSNGRETLDVVVTPDGSVVRVSDGAILRMYLGTRERYGSPTWLGGDRVCISGGDRGQAFRACYRLLMEDRDHVGAKLLWHVTHPGTLYDSGDYQIAHDGLVFSYGARLDAIRQDDGAAVFRSSSILWRRPGRCYSPLALAGPHLFVGDLGNWFGMKKSSFHASALSVTTVGRRPVVLARNRVERTNAAPVFDEDRLYVRQWYSLLCLAVTGEEGRRFEAETVARETLSSLFAGRPDDATPPVALVARPGEAKQRLRAARMPDHWTLLGPVAATQASVVSAHLRDSDLREVAARESRSEISIQGLSCRIEPVRRRHTAEEEYGIKSHIVSKVGQEFLARKEALTAEGEPNAWTEGVIQGESGFPGCEMVLRAGLPAPDSVVWLASVVQNERPRVLRFELDVPGARAWVCGVEVRHKQRVALPIGAVSVLVELTAARAETGIRFAPRFWPSDGTELDVADWIEGVHRRRPYLENAVRLSPSSDIGQRAKALLLEARQ